ncbi:hypothetical protein MY11210_008262 [Beauveria gryllotalpidicola]
MARFTFVKGRKKSPPQLLIAEPLSKAHKILGSTPISIDSPKPWDDASSGFSGGTATSYASTEDDSSDVHVAIAHSEDEWTSNSDMLPAIFESSGLESDSDRGTSKITRGLRETQSSSTIRSRYDISPSAPAMVKGVPSKIHKMLDLENHSNVPQLKKKPPTLDFSNLRNAPRLSRKASHSQLRTDETVANDVGSFNRSPSTSLTPNGKSQKIHKRNTKDEMPSPAAEESQHAHIMGGKHRGNSMKEAPSLYYHYEQMTLRQLSKKAETQEGEQQSNEEAIEEASTEDDEEPEAGQNLPGLHDILPPTPQTAFMTGLTPAAFRDRSNSTASKVTASTKRSKTIDRPDLQETSMLMLSSDSEDDGPVLVLHSQTNPKRHLPTSVATRTASYTQPSRAPSQASDYGPTHRSKKASFASANTYITFPNTSRLSTDTSVSKGSDSRLSTFYTDATSCRTSLMSNVSNVSTLHPSASYIQEARAVTMLAGRRPCRVERDAESSPDTATPLTKLPPAAKRLPTPAHTPEELTPPLSPTSVDFFLRSARSSVDDSGSHNRYMAVTRQEEMLLSALRNKQQHDKERPSEAPQQPAQGCNTLGLTRASTAEEVEVDENDSISSAEISAAEAMIEFGFPAPPTTRKKPFFQNALAASASQSRRASTATTDKLSQSSIAGTDSILDSIQPSLTPALRAEKSLKGMLESSLRREESEQREVILYLDDTESNPDTTDLSEFGYLTMPSLQSGRDGSSLHSSSTVSDTMLMQSSSSHTMATSDNKQPDCVRSSSPSAMVSVPEDGEPKYEYEDTPRPDSPVSPDIFPPVPRARTTPTNLARLSAVGSNEPGWWGDDD